MDLAVSAYKLSSVFPKDEKFGLTSQVRRAAVSVSSNIAEGAGRNTNNEFAHFLGVSNGSSYELQTQLIIAERLGYCDNKEMSLLLNDIIEVQKMNFTFQRRLKQ